MLFPYEETSGRKRRAGKELADFQKTLLKERKAGVPVAELAQKYEVSPAYIYQLKPAPAKLAPAKLAPAKPRKKPSRKPAKSEDAAQPAEAA